MPSNSKTHLFGDVRRAVSADEPVSLHGGPLQWIVAGDAIHAGFAQPAMTEDAFFAIKDNKLTVMDLVKVEQTLGAWIQDHICSVDIQLRGCATPGH
jgi:hypothetical protein